MATTRSPKQRRRLAIGASVLAAAVVAAGAYWGYVPIWPGIGGVARSPGVAAASRTASVELNRRLSEMSGALPGSPKSLGDAALDRCLREHREFGSDSALPVFCQRQMALYVTFDGGLQDVARKWDEALTAKGWQGSLAPLPPGSGYTAERYDYVDPVTDDYLVITMISDQQSLPLLSNEQYFEGAAQHRREYRPFGDRQAAESALSGRHHVAEISLIRTYFSEGPRPRPPY
ncbi:hypothetical protein [Kitasatospora sp. GP82]|uniref:hypothetical protein n=1 Tax=Kitasatospora sp. GP82 TaxID=3035089 RepID=UPI0024758BA2|nr:hypothetical protein [Kitasatospora sp. GP82]MDH6130420.1 hypothetical protein [Kitasatospora sp. GP82]